MTHPRTDDWYRQRLAPPRHRPRIVIDTDAANEIDDPFALAWALLSSQQLDVVAVYAAPLSFEYRRQEMLHARRVREAQVPATPRDAELLEHYAARLAFYGRKGWDLAQVDWPVFNPPGIGMERSFAEIVAVFD